MIEEETNPLWMPRGSVRALITIGVLAVTAYMVMTGRDVPEWWQLLNGGTAGSYFATRVFAPRRIEVKEPVNLDTVDLMRNDAA